MPHARLRPSIAVAALFLSLTACAVDPDLEVAAQTTDLKVGLSSTRTNRVTLHGRVFYNDRRNKGLFAARRTPAGAVGTRCGTSGVRADGTPCSLNWLGAQYAVVAVNEVDRGYGALDVNCKPEQLLGSVAVAYDGSFAVTVAVDDKCDHDDLGKALSLSVKLRYCGDWCFSVDSAEDAPYALYYPGASALAPLRVAGGDDITLPDMYFNPAGTSQTVANDTTKAVNYYASVVDTILTVHRDAGVPFYKDAYGEIQYIYPGTSSTATTWSPTEVDISAGLDTGWVDGKTPAHEYGHVLMLRAWDGEYGFDGIGHSAGDAEIADSRQIAFKEAWAEFVAHAVFPLDNGCDLPGFDDNASTPPAGPLGEGAQWRLNVTKSLCDWYDTRADDDLALAGDGDHFAAGGIYSMWLNLRNMYLDADLYGGNASGDGLWFCDFVDYYLDVRKSAAAVGAASHDDYVASITDVVYNNDIGCYLPAP